MKRSILFSLLLVFVASSLVAQEVQLPYPGVTALSHEKSKFYHNGEHISKRDCQTFLKLNAEQDIYNQYKSGLQMYQAGWSLMGIGLAVDAAFLTYSAVGIYYWAKTYDPERPTMGPGVLVLLGVVTVLPAFILFELPAIPLICVGIKRMKNSIDTYNIRQRQAESANRFWRIQPTINGVGLTYNF